MNARDLALLLRLSNLPTVWTNAACGWWLAGGGPVPRLVLAAGALSLLYSAGMVLNDVRDADRDRTRAPNRPIPAGRVTRRSAALLGYLLLAAGVGLAAAAGLVAGTFAVALAAAILLYEEIHADSPRLGPVIMGGCRALAVMVGAASADSTGSLIAWIAAGATGLSVIGISRLARTEDRATPGRPGPFDLALLAAPWVTALFLLALHLEWPPAAASLPHLLWVVPSALWLGRCVAALRSPARRKAIGDLLSGLCLADLALASLAPPALAAAFVAAFALCLLLRKSIPAS